MNRILTVNEEYGFAVIQPGVTQKQLSEHLQLHHPRMVLNVTGSGEATSIVGNVLERGMGVLGPRVRDLLGLEVVLGSGVVLRTGYWGCDPEFDRRFPPFCYRQGTGPDLTGLFTQSSLGVVTGMAIRLRRQRPHELAWIQLDANELPSTLHQVRDWIDERVLPGPFLLARSTDPRWQAAASPAAVAEWHLIALLNGGDGVLPALREEIRRRCAALRRPLRIVSDAEAASERQQPFLAALAALCRGTPTNFSLQTLAARKEEPLNYSDLDGDPNTRGMACVLLAVPFAAPAVTAVMGITEEIAHSLELEMTASFVPFDGDALEGFVRVYFARDHPRQPGLAHAWMERSYAACAQLGIYPYRMHVDGMASLSRGPDDAFWSTVGQIHRTLDPSGIFANGRYTPRLALD